MIDFNIQTGEIENIIDLKKFLWKFQIKSKKIVYFITKIVVKIKKN